MVWCFLDETRNISEWTPCSSNIVNRVNLRDFYDFSKPTINVSFYCQRPKRPIHCPSITVCHRDNKGTLSVQDEMLTADEKKMFPRDLSLEETSSSIKIRTRGIRVAGSTLPLCAPRLPETVSEGYWFNGTWNGLRCQTRRFPSARSMLECLRNKSLHFLGDSTTKQWWKYLTTFLGLGNREPDRYRTSSVNNEYNINLTFLFHQFPTNAKLTIGVNRLSYVAEGIDDIVGGPDVVIILGLWAHYMAEPMETFRSRVWGIRHAIERLHSRYPDTMVIWRTSNTNHHGRLRHFVENSDWYSYQLLLEVKKILEDVNVAILDVWEMSESMWHDAILHPPEDVIKEHVNLLLSYICAD
ncbi:NXPE family member 3-like [Branchiostoma floridae]|uniref:NXPE family member 3-like n=1 Tax=Branchiostoma floridae TaxID=7739 RepID=A0A9J7M9W9_BRAFL|nr:NXPE family member 3-like [Branchiostoma floridae]XP_035697483.1 NXPE family member 3-like [Branchiostoma floridae]